MKWPSKERARMGTGRRETNRTARQYVAGPHNATSLQAWIDAHCARHLEGKTS
jgi:hypothetical protein